MVTGQERELVKQRAFSLLRSNLRKGYDSRYRRSYSYVCPALTKYPWQWFWDSCFHAIALSHLDPGQAKEELAGLVASQDEDGFIGHVVYWGPQPMLVPWAYLQSRLSLRPRHTQLIQPPLLAQAVHQVFLKSQDTSFLRDMLPRLDRYYRWLASNRDPDGDGLISVISPYETGMDHKPSYDPALGLKKPGRMALEVKERLLDLSNLVLGANYRMSAIFARDAFTSEDVMVNCVYAQALRAMAELHRTAGSPADAQRFGSMADRTEQAILEKCYDPDSGVYLDLYSRKEIKLRTVTVTALLPIMLDTIPQERLDELVHRHLLNEAEFWLPYPVPSVSRAETAFSPGYSRTLWRGPTWLNMNWFLVKGLRKHGYNDVADRMVEKSVELVLKSGFREYYNPFTGEGLGARDFGWSTLVVDMVS